MWNSCNVASSPLHVASFEAINVFISMAVVLKPANDEHPDFFLFVAK
jgi:hypothetical protein